MSIHVFEKRKSENQKITMITCYDHWTAQIINQSDVDLSLIHI